MDILLVGTYTQHDAPAVLEKQELGKGIYLIPYNEILGDVAGTPLIIQMQNPSWVCLVKNRLFAVSESEDAAEIVEYEVGVQEERLTAEKKAGLQMPGKASCHIEKDEKGSETANTERNSYRAGVYAQTVRCSCCHPAIEKESVKIFEKDYHALRSAQIFLQIFCFRTF